LEGHLAGEEQHQLDSFVEQLWDDNLGDNQVAQVIIIINVKSAWTIGAS